MNFPTPLQAQTLPELLAARVAATPNAPAYREFDTVSGAWLTFSWQDMAQRVARWRDALAGLQLPAGARVAMLVPNSVDGVCLDQAALRLSLVIVPLHELDNPGSVAYILADSEAACLLVNTAAQWQAIAATGTALPGLRCVVCRSGAAAQDANATPPVLALADWLARANVSAADSAPGPASDDLATIVYTSGTTGKPKGVMLTHRNVVANVQATLQRVAPTPDDLFLSFLPLSHTFERTAGYYLPIAAGCCVAFARSVALLAEDMKTQRPTILISVPRIYERVYAKLQQTLGSGLKAWLFEQAQAVGWRRFRRAQHLPLTGTDANASELLDNLAWPLLKGLVASKIQAAFGGRLRVAVSGGAPLSPAIARCFLGLEVPVLQGYGMTETSPVVAANTPQDNDPATVGRALPGVEVKLGDNAELLVRGPSVMRGYWKRPEDTARVLSPEGWLSTGDQASIDDGRISIRGRIKEIIVTSTGEKIAPADVELAITSDDLFTQAYVVGEGRQFIACVVVLDAAQWPTWAAAQGATADAASLSLPALQKAALERIRTACKDFPHYAVPRAVTLSLEPWTMENALMTPTLKLKRNNLAKHFELAIEAMYKR